MRRDVDRAIEQAAQARSGAFTVDDVRRAGGDKHLTRRRIAAGRWTSAGDRVLLLAGTPASVDQRRWIGLLAGGSGARLTHQTAGELHGLRSVRWGLVVVTVDHPLHIAMDGVIYHQLVDLAPGHLAVVSGFPTTTVARTIVDLAAVTSSVRLAHAVEDAISRRLVTFTEIADVLTAVRRKGKPGVRRLVRTLDARSGEPVPASTLERLLAEAASLAGVEFRRQHPLPTRGVVNGVVDLAVLPSKLILEADGRPWHARLDAMARDRARDREAARLGWQTLRFVHEDLVGDLRGCADDIRAVHRARLSGAA